MHPSHKDHLGKLNRVSGQVEAVKRMIDEGKYCVDIMTQIRAARSALKYSVLVEIMLVAFILSTTAVLTSVLTLPEAHS